MARVHRVLHSAAVTVGISPPPQERLHEERLRRRKPTGSRTGIRKAKTSSGRVSHGNIPCRPAAPHSDQQTCMQQLPAAGPRAQVRPFVGHHRLSERCPLVPQGVTEVATAKVDKGAAELEKILSRHHRENCQTATRSPSTPSMRLV